MSVRSVTGRTGGGDNGERGVVRSSSVRAVRSTAFPLLRSSIVWARCGAPHRVIW